MKLKINPPGKEPLLDFETKADEKYRSFLLTRSAVLDILDPKASRDEKVSSAVVLLPSLVLDVACLPVVAVSDLLEIIRR